MKTIGWGILVGLLLLATSGRAIDPLGADDIIFHFHGPETNAYLGYSVGTLADINGDGFDDIWMSRGNPRVTYVFFGGLPMDTIPDMILQGCVWAAADLDGDGIKEVISSSDYGDIVPRITVYFFKGYGDSLGSVPYDSMWTVGDNGGRGQYVVAGNVDGNSTADLLLLQRNQAFQLPRIYLYKDCPAVDTAYDWYYQVPNYRLNIHQFGFLDFNGDGHQDIWAGNFSDGDSAGSAVVFFGPNFGTAPDIVFTTSMGWNPTGNPIYYANYVQNVGDVTGDGFDDLAIQQNAYLMIYLGGPAWDTAYDFLLQPTQLRAANVGDFNGDGFADLATGMSGGYGEDRAIQLFGGGPKFNGKTDGTITRDELPPLLLTSIGTSIAAAGDVNGDGLMDVIFACENFSDGNPGDVFVLAGTRDVVTPVEENREAALPTTLTLADPYPNPFNATLSIPFTINERQHVTIDVCNTLGQKVATLLDKELPAGEQRVTWKAEGAPSGVYFVRMRGGTNGDYGGAKGCVQTKRVVMVK